MNDLETMDRLAADITVSDFGPKMVVRNWDTMCASQMILGKGFPIRKQKSFENRQGKQFKYIDGIHSPLYGTTWEDDDAYKDRYSCQCGYRQGTIYEGEICPKCKEKVGYVDVDLGKFGWIQLNTRYKIINPAMFSLLQKFIGETTLDKMLKWDCEMDSNGHYIPNTSKGRDRFKSIGLIGFREKLPEIIEWYRPRRKKYESYYWEIIKKWDCIFASNIPVFSNFMRPIYTTSSEYHYTDAERDYNVIVGCRNDLNAYKGEIDESNMEAINSILYKIQQKVMAINDFIFRMLDKKTGHIHDGIFGGRMEFSARDVIVPNPELRANEIVLSYLAVVELYKLEIINLITKIHGCTYHSALKYWFDAHLEFSPFVYEIMKYLMEKTKGGLCVLANRNPTIDFGSFIFARIVGITDSYDNMTMNLPIPVLGKLNADFDGDTLNIYSLKTNDLKRKYSKFLDPTRSMFISRNNGFLDSQNFLKKDQLIGLHAFCTV